MSIMIMDDTKSTKRLSRHVCRLVGACALLTSASLFAEDLAFEPDPCVSVYLEGVSEFQQGSFQPAADTFLQAIRLSPVPGTEPDEYLPYLYLAAAYHEAGQAMDARSALEQSRLFGVAASTETGQEMLARYADAIVANAPDWEDSVDSPLASPVHERGLVLTDAEAEMIRAEVLKRCSLSAEFNPDRLPWYFHYEYGVSLMEAGDPERALDAFVTGANVREEPKRSKRMYGMWYIDYLPYYQIALAHSRLGNWRSADQALRTSKQYGEFDANAPGWEEYQALEQLIRSNVTPFDS